MNARYYMAEKKRVETKLDLLLQRIDSIRNLTPEEEIIYCTELSRLYAQADRYASELKAVTHALQTLSYLPSS